MLMGSDAPCPEPYAGVKGASVSIHVDTVEEAERLFAALTKDARAVTMPLGETFWALRFAMFVDRFGVPWMINCARPA